MRSLFSGCLLLAAGLATAAPNVTDVSFAENGDELVVNYTLDAAAIVVVDIQTNVADDVYASIGGEHQWTLEGDVNKRVEAGARSFTWTPSSDMPDCDVQPAKLKVVFSTYAYGDAPDYMVVALSTAIVDRVTYYPNVESLPGGLLSNGAYRASKLVMRHIHAKGVEWTMGTVGEGSRGANEVVHKVTLTNDYWIGVFEMTFAQTYRYGVGTTLSVKPAKNVNYNNVRGHVDTYDWPIQPAESSCIGKIRAATGLPFDFPSEAQWEFACRAGHGEGFWNDGSLIGSIDLAELACYGKPWSATDCGVMVGSFRPNSWGLYDMHGNHSEYCVDWYQVDVSGATHGEVAMSGENKVVRGGNFQNGAADCRSGARGSAPPGNNLHQHGFRLYSVYGFQDEGLVDAE